MMPWKRPVAAEAQVKSVPAAQQLAEAAELRQNAVVEGLPSGRTQTGGKASWTSPKTVSRAYAEAKLGMCVLRLSGDANHSVVV
ncbi:hypothetical protein WJX72_001074 [[Myrmecia] bisecta]|uniref:Uncharacterized protein n=1 Tax=[Myrmecia] bisecta TaxID=41462 RepID=A0AAW1P238_9CHLO